MGSEYSVNGYLNAVLRRSNRTLLVEGTSDKDVMHRILLEDYPGSNITIDHAGLINDETTSGFGNKTKVIHVREIVSSMLESLPRLESALSSLVDREWDGLQFDGLKLRDNWAAPLQGTSSFVTKGHSIENYYFRAECVVAYLKYRYPARMSEQLLETVRTDFNNMLFLAAAFSLAAASANIIGRCGGIVRPEHIVLDGNVYYLGERFADACRGRNIHDADKLLSDINAAARTHAEEAHSPDELQWLAHGHLGNDMIWACVAAIATSSGLPREIVNNIGNGYQDDKEHFCADWLSKLGSTEREPLDSSVARLTETQKTETPATDAPAQRQTTDNEVLVNA